MIKDLTNKKFGRLVVKKLVSERTKNGGAKWKCLCECGKIKITSSTNLLQGRCKSCGCLKIDTWNRYIEWRYPPIPEFH